MRDGLYKREGSEVWYALIYVNGQRFRESTGFTGKKEAKLKREEIKSRLIAQYCSPKANTVTWKNACIKWLTAAPRSDNDKYILRALDYPDRPLCDCTVESFEKTLSHLTNATYNRYRAIVVAVCNLSDHKLKLPTKKAKGVRLRFLTDVEWTRLYHALPAHLKAPALFSIKTGLRQHNCTHLRWDQIDLQGGKMWVHADESKSGKTMGFPLSPDAIEVLRGQIGKSTEWVFPYHGRGRHDSKNPMGKIKTAWQNAMERAGLGKFEKWTDANGKTRKKWHGDFTWHGLRHTWASWHLMAGTPIEVLAELGGWDDLRMVQEHYGHLATEHLARYAGNALPWGREKTATVNSHSAS